MLDGGKDRGTRPGLDGQVRPSLHGTRFPAPFGACESNLRFEVVQPFPEISRHRGLLAEIEVVGIAQDRTAGIVTGNDDKAAAGPVEHIEGRCLLPRLGQRRGSETDLPEGCHPARIVAVSLEKGTGRILGTHRVHRPRMERASQQEDEDKG